MVMMVVMVSMMSRFNVHVLRLLLLALIGNIGRRSVLVPHLRLPRVGRLLRGTTAGWNLLITHA